MALSESPKKIASDVADGLTTFNSANLRRFEAGDLNVIMSHLNGIVKEIRQIVIAMEDPEYTDKTKEKNRKMARINNACTVIRNYAHKRGIKVMG